MITWLCTIHFVEHLWIPLTVQDMISPKTKKQKKKEKENSLWAAISFTKNCKETLRNVFQRWQNIVRVKRTHDAENSSVERRNHLKQYV